MEVLYWILFGGAGIGALTGVGFIATKAYKYFSARHAQKVARETALLKAIAEKNKDKALTPTQMKDMAKQARKEQERIEKAQRKKERQEQRENRRVERGLRRTQRKANRDAERIAYANKKQIDINNVKLTSENDKYFREKIIGAKVQEATALREKGLKNLTKQEKARLAQLEREVGNFLSVNGTEPPLKEPKAKKVKEAVVANVPTMERDQHTNDVMNIKHARYEELLTKGRKKLNAQEKAELNVLHQEIEEFLAGHPTFEFEKGDLTVSPQEKKLQAQRQAENLAEAVQNNQNSIAQTEQTQETQTEQTQDAQAENEYTLPPSVQSSLSAGKKAKKLLKKIFADNPELQEQYDKDNEATHTHTRNDGTGAIS